MPALNNSKILPLLLLILTLIIHSYLALVYCIEGTEGEVLDVHWRETRSGTVSKGHSVLYRTLNGYFWSHLNSSFTDEGVDLYLSRGAILPGSLLDFFSKPLPKSGTGE
jgi:hypothetical protein